MVTMIIQEEGLLGLVENGRGVGSVLEQEICIPIG